MASSEWIVIASRSEARIFARRPFRLIKTLDNELGRLHKRLLTTDKPGMARGRLGRLGAVFSLGAEKNPHEDAAITFAKKISNYLGKQRNEHRFDEVVIVAEPKMMGRIRANLTKSLLPHVAWIKKDFGKLSEAQVAKLFGPPRRQPQETYG